MSTSVRMTRNVIDHPGLQCSRGHKPFATHLPRGNRGIQAGTGEWVDDDPTGRCPVTPTDTSASGEGGSAACGYLVVAHGHPGSDVARDHAAGAKHTRRVVADDARDSEVGSSLTYDASRPEPQAAAVAATEN